MIQSRRFRLFVELQDKIWLEFVQNKSSNGAVTLCKNCISDKILVHKLEAKIFLPYQIPGFLSSVSLKGIIEYQRVLSINRV